jgi:hypothetical protein
MFQGRNDNMVQHWRSHVRRLGDAIDKNVPLPPPVKPMPKNR